MRALVILTILTGWAFAGCDKSAGPPPTPPVSPQPAANPAPAASPPPAAPNPPSAGKSPAAGSGPPKWSAQQTVYEFGERWAGDIVTYPFALSNEGGQTLRILEAKPRCSCTVAENYSREIAPGE